MSARPRRSAAKRANRIISNMAEDTKPDMVPTRKRRSEGRGAAVGMSASITRGPQDLSSPPDGKEHLHLNVKVSSSKLRHATSGSSRPSRGGKKKYVVESDSDDDPDDDLHNLDEEDDEEDEDEDDADAEDDGEGDEDDEMMDVDAEGDDGDDADGEEDTEIMPSARAAVSVVKASKATSRKQAGQHLKSSDDELSELDSEEDATMIHADDDAEGEEDAEGEDDDDTQLVPAVVRATGTNGGGHDDEPLDSDMSQGATPDMAKMTKRQRARFEEEPQQYMKLSDEVQVKKHLTAEEQSMRRAEMARRRRNLSEKRNEEVKLETINKLLKKQAPKTNRKAAGQGDDNLDEDGQPRPNPLFVRWVSSKDGNRVGIPGEMLGGPAGRVFGAPGKTSAMKKMVEEVS